MTTRCASSMRRENSPGFTRPLSANRAFRVGHDHLVENLVALDHAELHAGALFDRLEALLQVAHLGIEGVVARLQAGRSLALLRKLAVELPHPQPASLADPERVLEGEEDGGEDVGEGFHWA